MAGRRHQVTRAEARRMAERSARSLGRGITEGRIEDHRPAGDRTSPVPVDRNELLAAGAVQAPRAAGAGRVSGHDNPRVQAVGSGLRARIDERSAHLTDATRFFRGIHTPPPRLRPRGGVRREIADPGFVSHRTVGDEHGAGQTVRLRVSGRFVRGPAGSAAGAWSVRSRRARASASNCRIASARATRWAG